MAVATRYGCRGLAAEFDIGIGGPAIAADGTIVEVRAAYGGARTQLRAADPVGAYDAVTKGYTGTIAATAAAATNGVTAAAIITDHVLVRGDGGARGIQGSGITVDDSNNVSGVGTLGCGAITSSSTIQCTTVRATNLTDGYIPYHVSDASGLANSGLYYSSSGYGIGTTTFGASAANVLSVGQGTAPGAAVDVVGVWAADNNGLAGNTALHIRPEVGYTHVFYSGYTLRTTDYVYTTTGSQVILGLGASTGNTYTQIAAYSSGGAALNVLKLRASGVLVTSDASVTTASAQLHSYATTEQLRLAYDATHYAPFTVGSTGVLTIAPNNAGAASYVSITGRLGVGTSSPGAVIEAALSTGVTGVKGTSDSLYGIHGVTATAAGVYGYASSTGQGVYGNSVSGYGGYFTSRQSNAAVFFQTGTLTANLASGTLIINKGVDGASTYTSTGNVISITDNPTNCTSISGYLITATIGSTERVRFNPRVADGATAVAYFEDTANALSTAGAKIHSFRTNGVEKAYIGGGGEIYGAGAFGCNGATPRTSATANALSAYATGAYGFDSDAHAQEIHTLLGQIRTALINNGIMVSA